MADHLDNFFDVSYYSHLKGGLLEASSRLFDKNVSIYVFPYKTKDACSSLDTFFAEKKIDSLLTYLKLSSNLRDLSNCNEVEESVLSSYVRNLLQNDDPAWKALVPSKIKDYIEKNGLFK